MTDPIDETHSHPAADPGTSGDAGPGAVADTGAATDPPLRVDPDRPSDSGWREPAWVPPRERARHRDRRPSSFAVVVGLIFIAVGAYYFLDRTLGIALPRIQWASAWPIILIVIGALILVRSFQRRA